VHIRDRAIHFGTVNTRIRGWRPTFDPESRLLWEPTYRMPERFRSPTAVLKWIGHFGIMVATGCRVVAPGCRWTGRRRCPISAYLQAEADSLVFSAGLVEVPLDVATGGDPCHALFHLAAEGGWPQQAG